MIDGSAKVVHDPLAYACGEIIFRITAYSSDYGYSDHNKRSETEHG